MPPRDSGIWMWAQALEMMDKAERMRQQFFQPGASVAGRRPTWQPPVDLIETSDEYIVVVALPGVRPDQLQVVIDDIRRPPKDGVKCFSIRLSNSSRDFRPFTLYSVIKSAAASSKRKRLIFAVIGMPSAIAPSRLRKRSRAISLFLL